MKRGFTLIELLVVVAIIGVLASVVLASLSSTRSKGSDAAIKSQLSSARVQAELYYNNNNYSYSNVCVNGTPGGIYNMISNAAKTFNGNSAVDTSGFPWSYSSKPAVCVNSGGYWIAMVSLKNNGTTGWCVDSTGAAMETTTPASISNTYCQ